MACCGRQRVALTLAEGGEGPPAAYRYQGNRTLVVRGAATGRLYRFPPGATLRVSAADARHFAGIPGLLRLNGAG